MSQSESQYASGTTDGDRSCNPSGSLLSKKRALKNRYARGCLETGMVIADSRRAVELGQEEKGTGVFTSTKRDGCIYEHEKGRVYLRARKGTGVFLLEKPSTQFRQAP